MKPGLPQLPHILPVLDLLEIQDQLEVTNDLIFVVFAPVVLLQRLAEGFDHYALVDYVDVVLVELFP